MNTLTRPPPRASPRVTTARPSAVTVSRTWPARPVSARVPHVASNVRPSAVFAPMRSPATARSPSSSASCAQTYAIGAPRNATRKGCRSASGAQRPAVVAPPRVARWLLSRSVARDPVSPRQAKRDEWPATNCQRLSRHTNTSVNLLRRVTGFPSRDVAAIVNRTRTTAAGP